LTLESENNWRTSLNVDVATATVADIRDLLPLYCGFMRHEGVQPPNDVELSSRLADLLASESDEILIARSSDGMALAFLQQRFYLSVWRPGRDAYIEDVFVREEARGRRIGELLLLAALENARARGALRISLDCNERNARARRLYERLDFQNPNTAWAGGRQLHYSRPLTPTDSPSSA
jgi:ribosomal protein S18 acetylase RimI-like enzyme